MKPEAVANQMGSYLEYCEMFSSLKSSTAGEREEWISQHKELHAYILKVSSWSDFAYSLLLHLDKKGSLTEKQVSSAKSMWNKHLTKMEKKARQNVGRECNLKPICELFSSAIKNKVKKPQLKFTDLTIYVAPKDGPNSGYLYVNQGSMYVGKITPEGEFFPINESREYLKSYLNDIAKDSLTHVTAYGIRTGSCSCCGRTLTNKESIKLGIGPVCRSRWEM